MESLAHNTTRACGTIGIASITDTPSTYCSGITSNTLLYILPLSQSIHLHTPRVLHFSAIHSFKEVVLSQVYMCAVYNSNNHFIVVICSWRLLHWNWSILPLLPLLLYLTPLLILIHLHPLVIFNIKCTCDDIE